MGSVCDVIIIILTLDCRHNTQRLSSWSLEAFIMSQWTLLSMHLTQSLEEIGPWSSCMTMWGMSALPHQCQHWWHLIKIWLFSSHTTSHRYKGNLQPQAPSGRDPLWQRRLEDSVSSLLTIEFCRSLAVGVFVGVWRWNRLHHRLPQLLHGYSRIQSPPPSFHTRNRWELRTPSCTCITGENHVFNFPCTFTPASPSYWDTNWQR